MEFLLASDRNFIAHTATTIASVLTWNPGSRIHLIRSEYPIHLDRKLEKFVSKSGGALALYEADQSVFESFLVDKHASAANYFRLQAPTLLPKDVDRVLYLDSDVLVRRSLTDLWSIDLNNCLVAACQDQGADKLAGSLGINPDHYFNSGVMLIPLAIWRERSLEEKLYSYVRKNNQKLEYWDQDALNAIIQGNWLPLSYSYNAQSLFYTDPSKQIGYHDALRDPHIVHFAGGGVKPWQAKLNHPLKPEYRRYRRMTPWPRFKEDGRDFRPFYRRVRSAILRMWDESLPNSHLGRAIQTQIRRTTVFKKLKQERAARQKAREAERIERRRRFYRDHEKRVSQYRQQFFGADTRVRSGPFAGMKCLERSTCSEILPKIAGTYEQPIQDIVTTLIAKNHFNRIINVGCAEGYYAVGFALGSPKTTVYAFDRSAEARKLCAEMAAINGVQDRLEILGKCDPHVLEKTCKGNSLVFCDIEGDEVDLLDPVQARSLKRTEILVETHDFLRAGATDSLVARFEATHAITMIVDHDRSSTELGPILLEEGIAASPADIQIMINEERPAGMRWLHMVPISSLNGAADELSE